MPRFGAASAFIGQVRHVLNRQHALALLRDGRRLVALLDLTLLSHVDADELVDARRQLVAGGAAGSGGWRDAAAGPCGTFGGGVADLAGLLAEDGAQQASMPRGQLGLAFQGDLAHQDIAGYLGAHADITVGIRSPIMSSEMFGFRR